MISENILILQPCLVCEKYVEILFSFEQYFVLHMLLIRPRTIP